MPLRNLERRTTRRLSMAQETEVETHRVSYEAAIAQHLAPLVKIGAQLEQLNRNLEALARVLEKRAAGPPPFRGRREERRPPWKQPRRRWQPTHAKPPVGGEEPRTRPRREEERRRDRNR
jgi:hypothetical protein